MRAIVCHLRGCSNQETGASVGAGARVLRHPGNQAVRPGGYRLYARRAPAGVSPYNLWVIP